jgi:hypothetical protein
VRPPGHHHRPRRACRVRRTWWSRPGAGAIGETRRPASAHLAWRCRERRVQGHVPAGGGWAFDWRGSGKGDILLFRKRGHSTFSHSHPFSAAVARRKSRLSPFPSDDPASMGRTAPGGRRRSFCETPANTGCSLGHISSFRVPHLLS